MCIGSFYVMGSSIIGRLAVRNLRKAGKNPGNQSSKGNDSSSCKHGEAVCATYLKRLLRLQSQPNLAGRKPHLFQ